MKWICGVFILSFCFFIFSCEGDQGSPIDYGPAVPQTSVDDALNSPLANIDPLKIQLGEFSDVLQSEILNGQAYETTGEVGSTVVGLDDQPTQIVFTILEKTVTYSSNQVIARELTRIAQKNTATDPGPSGSPTPAPSTSPTPAPSPSTSTNVAFLRASSVSQRPSPRLSSRWIFDVFSQNRKNPFVNSMILFLNKYLSVFATTPAPNPPTTFHNLVVQSASSSPPAAVQQQPLCGGIPNCKISLQKVSFDMLVWNNPTTPDKIHREFAISGDVPFFSNVMSECDSLLVPVGTIKTLVTLCSDVTNFRFSTP